jgi:hypothetical protein
MKRGGYAVLMVLASLAGCFYPPSEEPPTAEKRRVVLALPYDLAWDAVNAVIQENRYRINAQDPDAGIIEAQGDSFTLKDADCGRVEGIAGGFAAEPRSATAVYNFYVETRGEEASTVTVEAAFSSAVDVPFHQPEDVECVSLGKQESRLIDQIRAKALTMRRPKYTKPAS